MEGSFENLLTRAKIRDFRFHDLRHTLSVVSAKVWRFRLSELATALGHPAARIPLFTTLNRRAMVPVCPQGHGEQTFEPISARINSQEERKKGPVWVYYATATTTASAERTLTVGAARQFPTESTVWAESLIPLNGLPFEPPARLLIDLGIRPRLYRLYIVASDVPALFP